MLILFMFLLISGMFMYSYFHKHMLSMLLSLEYMVLSMFCLIFYSMLMFNMDLYFSMIFLILSVCEGALGLSIIVLMVRMYGNDYFSSLSVLMC